MNKIMRRNTNEGKETDLLSLVRYLLLAYIITAAALLFMALLLYKVGLGETAVSVGMILIYAGSTFAAGFLAGKKTRTKRYLWGLILGLAYFAVLVILSLAAGRVGNMFDKDFLTTLLLCAGGGMLGGMLS